MVSDPIADMLTRIRNAAMARHEQALIPRSNIKLAVAKLLKEEGYLEDVKEEEGGIQISLKYDDNRNPAFHKITRKSRPGLRIYVSSTDIQPVKSGLGVAVLSTSKGVLSDKQAREQKVGGELICEVW